MPILKRYSYQMLKHLLFMRELEFVSVAAIQLALEQAGAIICVNTVAVGDEKNHVAGLISGDVLELFFEIADLLVSLSAPVSLKRTPEASCVVRSRTCTYEESKTVAGGWKQPHGK